MKPRTQQQIKIYNLFKGLPKITAKHIKFGEKNVLKHLGFRTPRVISCMDCGHVFPAIKEVEVCKCPACKTNLTIKDTMDRTHSQREFMVILSVVDGYQVNRFLEFRSYHRKGEKARFNMQVVSAQFMNEQGEMVELISRNIGGIMGSGDTFCGELEIKRWNARRYDIYASAVYPNPEVLPVIKRNGFDGNMCYCTPFELFNGIINQPKAETLLKAKQYALVGAVINDYKGRPDKYWNSIKICMRNNYIITDAGTWFDYLELLTKFKKDLNSPKYLCPADLDVEHNRLVRKKQAIIDARRRKEDEERKRQRAIRDKVTHAQFVKDKKAFFGICFSSGDITVKVLDSIQEFIDESKVLAHCVFTNEYYAKKDSLILSARIDGVPIETIEVSLKTMKIVQSRGFDNKATKHNEAIVKLVQKNIPTIKKTYKSIKQKQAA